MSTHNSLDSMLDSLVTNLQDFSSSLSALRCTVHDEAPPTKRQTRSQSIGQFTVQHNNPAAELLATVLVSIDGLSDHLQTILLQANDARAQAKKPILPGVRQVMEATNQLQMDGRSGTSCERHISTQHGVSTQGATSKSQANETSSSQLAQTSDGQQPGTSEYMPMTESDLAGTDNPPHSHNDRDATSHVAAQSPTTPIPSKQGARLESRSFTRGQSVLTQSSASSTAADTSPAGSVGTHITWPESSGRACDEEETMLDINDADEVSGSCLRHDDKAGSPVTQSPAVSNETSSSNYQGPAVEARADQSPRNSATDKTSSPPPTVNDDTRPNAESDADDDLTQVLDSAIEMLSAATTKPPMRGHSPGSDEQHAGDQQTESSSASPTREESDGASEEAEPNAKPSAPPKLQNDKQINPHPAGDPTRLPTCDRATAIEGIEDISAEDTLMADDWPITAHSNGAHTQATSHMRSTQSRPRVTTVTIEEDKQQDEQDTLYEQFILDSENTPILKQDQLGVKMPETLAGLAAISSNGNKARLPWITERISDININESLIPNGDPDVKFNEFARRDDGSVHIYRDDPANGREFEWPDFETTGRPTTAKQASQALADFLTDPGRDASYYCGLMKSELWSMCALYPGKLLANVEGLTHVNEIYTHLGKKNSGTAMHKEDDKLRSVNVAFAGTKLFLLIDEEDTEKFEEWVRATYECKPCPQFVRHLNIFFNPLQLQAAGIRFKILIQRAGDLIETQRGQYHQVLNIQDSLAISINYLRHSETPNFMDPHHPLEVCDECGLKGLFGKSGFYVKWVDLNVAQPGSHRTTLSGKGCKRKAPREPLDAASRNTRAYAEAFDTFAETRTIIRNGNPSFTIPTHPSLDEQHVLKMAAAVLSPSAITQFTELVAAWRNRDEQKLITDTGDDGLKQCAAYLKNASSKSLLGKFQLRYARLAIARQIEDDKRARSQVRLGKKIKAELAKRLGLTADDLSLSLDEGRMWNRVCGDFPGMLAFIPLNATPPFYLSRKEWKELNSAQLKALRRLVANCESFRELCLAGTMLQDIISRGSETIFSWEEHGYQFSDSCYLARTL